MNIQLVSIENIEQQLFPQMYLAKAIYPITLPKVLYDVNNL
jgi:hypothetical protein